MRINIIGYFDVGFSIGIDDAPFSNNRREKFEDVMPGISRIQAARTDGSREIFADNPDYGMDVSLGKGLRFALSGEPILGEWLSDAARIAENAEFGKDYEISDDLRKEVAALHRSSRNVSAWVDLRSCGIAMVELEIQEIPETVEPEIAMRFAQTFECAAYGTYGSTLAFRANLKEGLARILNSYVFDPEIKEVTERAEIADPDIFPGFSIVFFSDTVEYAKRFRIYREGLGDSFTDLNLDGNGVAAAWYVCIVVPRKTERGNDAALVARHVSRLIGLYSLFFGLIDSHQKLLAHRVSKYINDGTTDASASVRSPSAIIKLRTLSQVFISYTNVSTLTQNQEITELFSILDREGKLPQRHENIQVTVEILISIQNQVEDAENARQEKKVNTFISVITSLTFVSVVADALNIDALAKDVFPAFAIRAGIYVAILVCFVFLFRRIFRK
jgi:hypothetical protein